MEDVNDPMNELWEMLKSMPIDPVPCARCVYLREAHSKVFAEHMVVCGYFDDHDRMPLAFTCNSITRVSDAIMSFTRKTVFGPHTDARPRHCGTFVSKETKLAIPT